MHPLQFAAIFLLFAFSAWARPDFRQHSVAPSVKENAITLRAKSVPPKNAGPPSVVFLNYGRVGGDEAVIQGMYTKEKLERCGIPVIQLDDVPASELEIRLRPHSLHGSPIFFLNSHGSANEHEQGDDALSYTLSSDHSPLKSLNGNELVKKISDLYPGARTWGGTCHAGACEAPGCLFGGECSFDEKAPGNVPAWNDLVDLMCDGYSGECAFWNVWDRNHDGTLSAIELETFFKRDAKDDERVTILRGEKRTDLQRKYARYETLCKTKMNGVAAIKTAARHNWSIRAEVWDGTGRVYRNLIPKGGEEEEATFSRGEKRRGVDPQTVSDKTTWEFHVERLDWAKDLDSIDSVRKQLAKQHSKWPVICGSRDNSTYKNCTIEDENYAMEVSCSAKRGGYKAAFAFKPFQPQPGNFFLTAPRCQTKHKESLLRQVAIPSNPAPTHHHKAPPARQQGQ